MNIILVILALYLIAMFCVGIYGRRYIKNFSDFIAAGRRGTLLMICSSFMASAFGGGFVVGGAEHGAAVGIGGSWYGIANSFQYWCFLLIVREVFRMGKISIPDLLEEKYGKDRFISNGFALINIFASTGIVGGQIMAGQRLLQGIGVEPTIGAIVSTLITIIYSAVSGLWGVLATDVLQIIIGTVGITIAAFTLVANNGLSFLTSSLPASHFNMFPFSPFEFSLIVVPTALYGFISQPSFQRISACKDEETAWKSPLYAGLILLPISFIPPLMGMYGRAFYPDLAPGAVFTRLLVENLPPVIGGLTIAAIFAALMSTNDTMLLAITAHAVHDIYKKNYNPDASDETLMKAGYWTTLFFGIAALVLSLQFSTIISLLSFVYSVLVAGTLIPVLGAFFWKDGTANGAKASMIAGIVTLFLGRWNILPIPYPHLVALIPSAIAYVVFSNIKKSADFSQ